MAQFYASIQGNGGEATRLGTKSSGMTGHIRGWNIGGQVEMHHENGSDVVSLYLTHGSDGGGRLFIGEARLIDGRLDWQPAKLINS